MAKNNVGRRGKIFQTKSSSSGGSFTCTDVGSCVNNATAGTPTAAGVIPFYESGLKKVTFTNFFNALKAGFDFFYGSLSVQNTLVAAMSKCIAFDPAFDNTKTVINIPHGLSGTPSFYPVSFTKGVETDAALANYTVTASSTNITITFAAPPQSPTPFGATLIMLIVKL